MSAGVLGFQVIVIVININDYIYLVNMHAKTAITHPIPINLSIPNISSVKLYSYSLGVAIEGAAIKSSLSNSL